MTALNRIIDQTISSSIAREMDQIEELQRLLKSRIQKDEAFCSSTRALQDAQTNLERSAEITAQDFKDCFSRLLTAARLMNTLPPLERTAELRNLKTFSQQITESIERLDQLADEVLSLSGSGLSGLQWTDFHLEEVCLIALQDLNLPDDKKPKLEIVNNLSLQGNISLISLLFQCLFSNIVRTAASRTSIEVKAVNINSEIIIAITNKMPDTLFSLNQDSSKQNIKVCENILAAHGGRIWIKSSPQGSLRYLITLPSWQSQFEESEPVLASS